MTPSYALSIGTFPCLSQAGSRLSASCWKESIWTAVCQRVRQLSGPPPLGSEVPGSDARGHFSMEVSGTPSHPHQWSMGFSRPMDPSRTSRSFLDQEVGLGYFFNYIIGGFGVSSQWPWIHFGQEKHGETHHCHGISHGESPTEPMDSHCPMDNMDRPVGIFQLAMLD